jgi:hypothetical protein
MTRWRFQRACARTLWGIGWLVPAAVALFMLEELWQLPATSEVYAFERGMWTAAGILAAGTGRFLPIVRLVGTAAHEYGHALAAGLSAAVVYDIQVQQDAGLVRASKTNAFIALTPYTVPLIPLVCAALILCLPPPGPLVAAYLAGLGYVLYLEDTLRTLWIGQPDIQNLHAPILVASTLLGGNLTSLVGLLALLFRVRGSLFGALLLRSVVRLAGLLGLSAFVHS